jgi:hypothetical protein
MIRTSQKNKEADCFVCYSENITTYKLYGRKLLSENFKDFLYLREMRHMTNFFIVMLLCAEIVTAKFLRHLHL